MATDDLDDVFSTPQIDVDLFGDEVEALVVSAYKAAIEGIDRLDKRERPRPDLASNPELQIEVDLWEQKISAMKYHAGNMGLVSLVFLFGDWLHRNGGLIGLDSGLKSRYEEMRTARNSIIHHRGSPRFVDQRGNPHTVSEDFLNFDEASGEESVAIEDSVLISAAGDLMSHVNRWI